jgi:energy-coupling factor transporter ATP-binding protein EcfA2
MLPLPIPQRGGSVQALRDLINVKADDDFILVIAWLLAALRDQWSYPVLVVTGQHGSAKSTLLKILRRLIDPHRADLRVPPKNADDLYVTAARSHVMAYDNLRTIADWLSDGFARIATGTAYVKRKLYTDQDETLVVAKKPIALNGITEIVGAADLGDRSIFVTATPIEKKDRKTEEEIWTLFERVHPAILGALLDAVVQGLGRLAEVRLDELPRMADFARWGTACEGAYAPRRGAFMTAYAGNRAAAVNSMIEGDAVAGAVLRVRRPWAGPLHELLSDLNSIVVDQQARGRSWPTSPRGLGDALREAAPLLRERGVSVEAPLKTDKTRTWRVTDADEKRPQVMDELQNSPNSPNSPTGGKDGGETASTP